MMTVISFLENKVTKIAAKAIRHHNMVTSKNFQNVFSKHNYCTCFLDLIITFYDILKYIGKLTMIVVMLGFNSF